MRIDCFDKIKHKEVKQLQQAFNALVPENTDLSEQEQKEIGKKIALDYYNQLNQELADLKKSAVPGAEELPAALKNIIGKGISSDDYFTDKVKSVEKNNRGFVITDNKDQKINVIFDRGQLWTDAIQDEKIKGLPKVPRPVYVQSSDGWKAIGKEEAFRDKMQEIIKDKLDELDKEAEKEIKQIDPKLPPSKLPVKARIAQRKVRDEKAAEDLKAKLLALKNLGKNGGITLTSGGFDPKRFELATEIIAGYIKQGVYKFSDIIEDAYAAMGEGVRELYDMLKSAYGAYYFGGADQIDAEQMDLSERNLTFDEITQDMSSEEVELEDFEKVEKSESRRQFIDIVKGKIKNQEKQNIVSLRKLAAELGIDVVDTNLQEMAEKAVVELSREMANKSWQEKYILEGIIDIYDNQPTISMRSANRIELQQYSTPAPMAYLAGLYVATGNPGTVFEPSAGNGIMTIAFKPEIVTVNEIDPVRLDNLAGQGFKQVTDQDALKPFPSGKRYGGLVMNPPFGSSEQIEVNGYKISGLAQKMAINALTNLKPNGRAAIIIGGHNEYDDKGRITSERTFFNWLYNQYNVAAVINISGELYAKQGTQFPTRLILIHSKKAVAEGATPINKGVFKPFSFWTLPGHGDQLTLSNGKKITVTQEVKGKGLAYAVDGTVMTDAQVIKFLNDNKAISEENTAQVVTSFYDLLKIVNDLKNATYENILQPGMDADRNDGDAIHGKGADQLQPDNEGRLPAIPPGQVRPNSSGRNTTKGNTGTDNGNIRSTDTNKSDTNGIGKDDNGNRSVSDMETDVPFQEPGTGNNGGTGIGNISGNQPIQSARKFESGELSEKAKVPYVPKSSSQSVDTVIPSRMATDAENILTKINNEYGGIDNFVQKKLGYATKEELFNALSGEQVDAVAMTIVQIEQGQGMIIGDMTGVGKGRIAASILRYGINQGLKPIFLTETPGLFSDLYRDLVDIDPTQNKSWSKAVKPFIVNDKNSSGDPTITDKDGNVVHKLMPATTKKGIFQNRQIPKDANFVLATYSQFGTSSDKPSAKKDFFSAISEGNILILDESHNVAGQSNRGEFFKEVISTAKGVLYLSATFAKTPQAMPVYAMKTAMQEANMSTDELVRAIENGGVALQEVVAAQLVESGQMLRRERSFEGVNVDYEVLEETGDEHRKIADSVTEIVRDIIDFQAIHVAEVIQAMDDIAVAAGSRMVERGGTNMAGVNNQPFASKVFNVIDQLLFSIKALDIADAAIEELKANRKPVIGFKSTMGSFLDHIGAQPGERLEKIDFSLTLKRALEGVMRYTEKDAQGNSIPGTISLADLSPEGREEYQRILDKILKASSGITISPIDVMIKRIQDAGYTVKEITGRNIMLDIQDDGSAIVTTRFEKDKKKIVREFNSGELDVIMLNMSGATGISMHASSKFKDQRQRVMIDGQLELDINKAVQKRGRIDRVGQVVRGAYRYIVSAIQAESRLLMMFKKKLKSLDANTTSSQKSIKTADVVDFLNKYGDEIVTEYLKENRELNDKLLDPLKFNDKSDEDLDGITKIENAALKVTGRVAILPTREQNEFYKEVSERYTDYIEYLESNNSNDLEVKVLPLNAKTLTSDIIVEGRGGDSPFGNPSILEQIETDVLKKPLKKEDIDKEVIQGLDGVTPEQKSEEVLDGIEGHYDGVIEQGIAKLEAQHEKNKVSVARNAREKAIENNSPDIEGDVEGALERLEFAKNEAIKRLETRNNFVKNNLSRLARYFKIGNLYEVPISVRTDTTIGTSKGIFLGFSIKKNRKNPYAPSAINMRFAVNDSRRIVSIPLSKQDFINAVIANSSFLTPQARQNYIDNWDSLQSTRTRENRFMITGNLLQAYGTNDGHLVSYTDDQGNLLKGILLPESYKVQEQKRRIPINQAAPYLQTRGSFITTVDRDVVIKKESTGYTITVPLTKKAGGKYFLNKGLQQLVNERGFNQMAGKMTAYFSDSKLQDILDFLQREYNSSIEVDSKINKAELRKESVPEVDEELDKLKEKEVSKQMWISNIPIEKLVGKYIVNDSGDKYKVVGQPAIQPEGRIIIQNAEGRQYTISKNEDFYIQQSDIDYAVAEPVSEDVQDLIDAIQEEVDNGITSLKIIQDKVADAFDDNSEELRSRVAEAYKEYTNRFTPDEINQAINKRLSDNLSAAFGGVNKVQVLRDEDVIPMAEQLGDVTYNTVEQEATQQLLDNAKAEYQTAKKAFEAKRKSLDKAIGADQADLFGERPKAPAAGLFDERVSQSGRDKAMEPFKARMVKAENEVNRLQKKLDNLGNQTAQTSLFHVVPDGNVNSHTNISTLKNSPDYKKAKSGDVKSAFDVVSKLYKSGKNNVLAKNKDAIIVSVHGIEATGQNALPNALAEALSNEYGNNIDTGIILANKPNHTNASAMARLLNQPAFDGPIISGKKYFIVDDVSTTGSTANALKNYIERQGGEVIGASFLGTAVGGGYFQPQLFEIQKIKAKFGEEELTKTLQQYGIADNIEQLSRQQISYIEKFDNAFQFRERIREEYEIESNKIVEANKKAGKIGYDQTDEISNTGRNFGLSGRATSAVPKEALLQEAQKNYQTKIFGEEVEYKASSTGEYPAEESTKDYQTVKGVWTKDKNLQFSGQVKVKDHGDVAHIMRLLETKSVEHGFAVHIDRNGKAHIQFLSLGGLTGTVMDPRAVMSGVSRFKSKKVYIVHNHPSGNPVPSAADIELSKRVFAGLRELGIDAEHLIMDTFKGEYTLITNDIGVEQYQRIKDTRPQKKITAETFDTFEAISTRFPETIIRSGHDAAIHIQQLQYSALPKKAMLVLSRSNNIIGNYMLDDYNLTEVLSKFSGVPTATSIIFYGNTPITEKINKLKQSLKPLDINVLDYLQVAPSGDISKQYKSAADEGLLNDVQAKYDTNLNKPAPKSIMPDVGLPLFMRSPEGKILGFTHGGKIYLNGKHLNPNTPIHEAGHIWLKWAEQYSKAVYKRGIELVTGSKYYDKIKANKFYQSEAAKLPADQRENYFKQEALATAIGDKGAQFVTEAKKKGFTEWLNNLWNSIKNALGFKNITAAELQNLTFEEFTSRAAADILRERTAEEQEDEEEGMTEEEQQEEKEQQNWEDSDPIADIEMTTSGEVADMISGKTITEIFGDAPEGDQSYDKQKLVDMLQDGKNMIGAAMGKWGTDIAVYGPQLFAYIKNMSTDKNLMAKKVALMATFLGEIKEEIYRNPEKMDQLRPLENAVTAYYQNYMMNTAKSLSAGRILRLYRDKYMGDIFAHQILEEQEIRDQAQIRKLQAEQMAIDARVAAGIEEFKTITQAEKDAADAEAAEKANDAKIKQQGKKSMAPTDAQKAAAAKAAEIKKKGGLTNIVDKIKNAINKCK